MLFHILGESKKLVFEKIYIKVECTYKFAIILKYITKDV